ncbi:unnamed protein product [Rangifer tarandus platyrhynchus]|uniref:Uncharacterized protein n=1 Tax=Rangifer tarandus platyrhynchus TaxID=3082113 RepID=A0ABN8Z9F3_RANTA|nr:unnamed protein product [Rangifer tarandus platyrhynchus]CAI9688790.1 unnamed protein product [Rangifer tarandus platyrhynchus]
MLCGAHAQWDPRHPGGGCGRRGGEVGAQWAPEPSPAVRFSRNQTDTAVESRGLWPALTWVPSILSTTFTDAVGARGAGRFRSGCRED